MHFAVTVVVGGVASMVAGGKFENGATTAAFGYLFNNCSRGCDLFGTGRASGPLGFPIGDARPIGQLLVDLGRAIGNFAYDVYSSLTFSEVVRPASIPDNWREEPTRGEGGRQWVNPDGDSRLRRRLLAIEKLDVTEKRQVLQVIDAFIERGQLKRKAENRT